MNESPGGLGLSPALSTSKENDRTVGGYPERLALLEVDGRRLAAAFHDAGEDSVVVLAHGFRGEKTGPNRTFVRVARALAELGVSSVRFDQYGSGDSEGEFLHSSFTSWIHTCRVIVDRYLQEGRLVALFGQSMGASASICAAANLPSLTAVVAWVPDASIDTFHPQPAGFVEEGGQRVSNQFWHEAHHADVPGCFKRVAAPTYLVFGTADEYVSEANRTAVTRAAKPADVVDIFEGYPHSAWTAEQTDTILERSVTFLAQRLHRHQ